MSDAISVIGLVVGSVCFGYGLGIAHVTWRLQKSLNRIEKLLPPQETQ